jgi:hypothetical protein
VSHLPGYDHDITPHTYRQVATAIRQLAYGTRANLLAGVADGRQILETEYEDELGDEDDDDFDADRLHVGFSGAWFEGHEDWHVFHDEAA